MSARANSIIKLVKIEIIEYLITQNFKDWGFLEILNLLKLEMGRAIGYHVAYFNKLKEGVENCDSP